MKGQIPVGAKPYKKGESGNPNGRPHKLPDLDALMAIVLGEEKKGKTAAEAILAALRAKAIKGDIRAAEVLLNRGYGFPRQKLPTEFGREVTVRVIRDPNA
jgi:hypothetical protein